MTRFNSGKGHKNKEEKPINSDQLLRNLDDCAKASMHEPDAETINAAMEYIMQLERENHNQDLTIDEKNERIAQLEAQLENAERDAWNAAIAGRRTLRIICKINRTMFTTQRVRM